MKRQDQKRRYSPEYNTYEMTILSVCWQSCYAIGWGL